MNTSTHAFVTVDLQGLKAPLVACAAQRRVSVSAVVRKAVAFELDQQVIQECAMPATLSGTTGEDGWVKVSVRLRPAEVLRLDAGSHAANLSRGAYMAGLIDGIPALVSGGGRPEYIAALTASCSELSTLSRNIHQLTALLRVGDVQQALVYRELLDHLDEDVRRHLRLAAQILRDLRPSGGAKRSAHATERHGGSHG